MNAALLLKHFDRLAEAPDAVPRLRRFILDLAVRGKLVEQDPNDEPASQLLKRIEAEKARLVKAGEIRKPRDLGDTFDIVKPFPVPPHWLWVRLDAVGAIVGGGTPSSSDPDNFQTPGNGIPWLTPADLGKHLDLYIQRGQRDLSERGLANSSATLMPKGSVLFSSRAPIGYVKIAEVPISTNQGFKSVVPFLNQCSRFIAVTLQAFAPTIDASASGTTFREVSGKVMAGQPFPLPPLAEQHRIVAKVDELMALCDRLEAAQAEREVRRDRLTAASLHRLNKPDFEEAREENVNPLVNNLGFHLANLFSLTSNVEQVAELRRALLGLAVRGRLTSRKAKDGSASVLLNDIEIRKNSLLKAGALNEKEARLQIRKHSKQALPDILSPLPDGWRWCTLVQASLAVVDCHNKTAPYSTDGVMLLRTTNIRGGKIDLRETKFVTEETYTRWSARLQPQPGDIIITREAPMGEVGSIPEGARICLGQRLMLIRLVPDTVDRRFLLYSLQDPHLMERVQDKPVGATVQHLRVGGVETLLIPLPPLAEQRRIVERIEELMVVCDRLEASLRTGHETSRRLLEAVLHDTLKPALEEVAA